MAHALPARLTPAELRSFGFQVGLAFVVLGALAWWRGRLGLAPWLGGLGAALLVAGLAVPTVLGPVHRAWMGLATVLSKVTTPILMAVIYFVVITPIGLVMRALGKSPLPVEGRWYDRDATSADPRRMERQF